MVGLLSPERGGSLNTIFAGSCLRKGMILLHHFAGSLPGVSPVPFNHRFLGSSAQSILLFSFRSIVENGSVLNGFSLVSSSPSAELRRVSFLAPEEGDVLCLDACAIDCWAIGHVVESGRFLPQRFSSMG
ncbi:unnamed protein product [Brassica rapa]|uniref:Uncharacterized protein n=1 Tax=Brassica campestris TaxID=3711 RepID=A0A8D9HQR2_BRACM|nr:unnamed protein product [Brassica rapa]